MAHFDGMFSIVLSYAIDSMDWEIGICSSSIFIVEGVVVVVVVVVLVDVAVVVL